MGADEAPSFAVRARGILFRQLLEDWVEIAQRDDAIIVVVALFLRSSALFVRSLDEARSPSGKAKVCKTFIGGSIPPRASNSS